VSAFVDQERERFAVELICRTLGVSLSAYYQRATGERSARAVEDERLLERIRALHAANFDDFFVPRALQDAALELLSAPAWHTHLRRLATERRTALLATL